MTCREKKKQRQHDHDIKIADGILSGKAAYIKYEQKKKAAQGNRKGGGANTDSENDEMAERATGLLRLLLPAITAKMSDIYDPRDQRKITHNAGTIMTYGLLMFLSHMSSRREANRRLGGEGTHARLSAAFPELATMPHADTLDRFLSNTHLDDIVERYEEIISGFLKSPAFRSMNKGRYIIAIDGSGKFMRRHCWSPHALRRKNDEPGKDIYYAYMLDSVLIMENGISIPLLTEPVANDSLGNGDDKQDCELRAFHRLADRLLVLFGKGQVTLLLDGIYANGPVISKCNKNGWDYMTVLKSDSLKSVWDEYYGLCKAEPSNVLHAMHGDRAQVYSWANGIEYQYGNNNHTLKLNLVTCHEQWEEAKTRSGRQPEKKSTHYAWLSSEILKFSNVFARCNNIGRARWWIESSFHVEKHQGYYFGHCFSYDWDAMMGYHHLMKLAHFINILITHSKNFSKYVALEGYQGLNEKLWSTILQHGVVNNVRPPKRRGRPKAVGTIDYLLLYSSA